MTRHTRRVPTDDGTLDSITDEERALAQRPLSAHVAAALANPASAEAFTQAKAEIDGRQATLRRVREARALTQATVGDLLDMTQSEVSRLERRRDVMLSTLRRFVEATGGELHLVASYPDSAPIELSIGDTRDDEQRHDPVLDILTPEAKEFYLDPANRDHVRR